MEWKHYNEIHNVTVKGVKNESEEIECVIQIGYWSTGRSRVYMGIYCRITYDGDLILVEGDSYYRSVRKAVRKLNGIGIELDIFATHYEFYQSGLSCETAYGYMPNLTGPVLMTDYAGDYV